MNDLILVPTPRERDLLCQALGSHPGWTTLRRATSIQLCGFGPIASAASTALRIARSRPRRVILLGIAGTFDVDVMPVGEASQFEVVQCEGIGVGQQESFISAHDLGWPQWQPGSSQADADVTPRTIGDVISLSCGDPATFAATGKLLTVCSASSDFDEAQRRRRRYPDVIAEDMEGFGVALACQLADTPLQIVRGISNFVGDRDHGNWQIETALSRAANLAVDLLSA